MVASILVLATDTRGRIQARILLPGFAAIQSEFEVPKSSRMKSKKIGVTKEAATHCRAAVEAMQSEAQPASQALKVLNFVESGESSL
jgi:hypothetical protein